MEEANYIISWVFNFIIATCTIWAAIKYVEPIKYIRFYSVNKFLKYYISFGNFCIVNVQEHNLFGDISVYFESIKNGLWKEVLIIRKFNIKTDERKIERYISQTEKSSLFIIYNDDGVAVIRLNAIL